MSLANTIILCMAAFFFGGIFLLSYLSRRHPSQSAEKQSGLDAVAPPRPQPIGNHNHSDQLTPAASRIPSALQFPRPKKKHNHERSRHDRIRKAS